MTSYSEAAHARDADGRYAPMSTGVTTVDLDDGPLTYPYLREEMAHEHARRRAESMDPVTGACEAKIFSSMDEPPVDVANTPADRLSDDALRFAIATHQGHHLDRSAMTMTEAMESVQSRPDAPRICHDVQAHEENGGAVELFTHRRTGAPMVRWVSRPGGELYRDTGNPVDNVSCLPAEFTNGSPTTWCDGSREVKEIDENGATRIYAPDGSYVHTSADRRSVYFLNSRGEYDRDPQLGPAVHDVDEISFRRGYRHGLSRDPTAGPALYRSDGSVEYADSSFRPSQALMEAHNTQQCSDRTYRLRDFQGDLRDIDPNTGRVAL